MGFRSRVAGRGRPWGPLLCCTLGLLAACHRPLPERVRHRLAARSDTARSQPATQPPAVVRGSAAEATYGRSTPRPAAPLAGASNPQELTVDVDRIWDEGELTFMDVIVTNDSSYRLSQVALRCRVTGNGTVNMHFPEQTILSPSQPPLDPGHRRLVEVRLQKGVFDLRQIGCGARGW